MKKVIFIFAILLQTAYGFAKQIPDQLVSQVTTDNVKMYKQPGTSTELIMNLKTTDKVVVVRKHNANWSIVMVGEQVGYVLNSELTKPQVQQALALDKKN